MSDPTSDPTGHRPFDELREALYAASPDSEERVAAKVVELDGQVVFVRTITDMIRDLALLGVVCSAWAADRLGDAALAATMNQAIDDAGGLPVVQEAALRLKQLIEAIE
jgi:hypothetical protein